MRATHREPRSAFGLRLLVLALSLAPTAAVADGAGRRDAPPQRPAASTDGVRVVHPALRSVQAGSRHFNAGRFDEALRSYRAALPGLKALRADNTITDAHFALVHFSIGVCHERRGEIRAAIEAMRRAQQFVHDPARLARLDRRIADLETLIASEAGADTRPTSEPIGVGGYFSYGHMTPIYSRDRLDLSGGTDAGGGARVEIPSSRLGGRLGGQIEIGVGRSHQPFSFAGGRLRGHWEWESLRSSASARVGVTGRRGLYVTLGGHMDVGLGGRTHALDVGSNRTIYRMGFNRLLLGGQSGVGYLFDLSPFDMSFEVCTRYTFGSPVEGGRGHTFRTVASLVVLM